MSEDYKLIRSYDKYGKDIDDNCPMTGDETDTDCNAFLDVQVFPKNHKLKDTNKNNHKSNDEEIIHNNIEFNSGKIDVLTSNKDVEEALSSDQHYFSDEESSIAGSYDDMEKSEFDEEDHSFNQVSAKSCEEVSQQQVLEQHLDQLGEIVLQREYMAQKCRADLQIQKDHLKMLKVEMKNLKLFIKETSSDDIPILNKLKNEMGLLTLQIKKEEDNEKELQQKVKDAEFFIAQSYIEHGKFLSYDKDISLDQGKLGILKIEKANNRLKKEMTYAVNIDKKRKAREKEHISASRERERKNRQAIISAKKNREVAMKYLKETMSRVRQKDVEDENKSRKDLDRRVNILLNLKRNIQLSKENDSILLMQNRKKKEDSSLILERKKPLEKSPDDVLVKKNNKAALERKQREKEIQVANKFSDEKHITRHKMQQRVSRRRLKPRGLPSSGSESVEYGADVEDTITRPSLQCRVSTDEDAEFSPFGLSTRDEDGINSSVIEDTDVVVENEDTLAEPDFEGLWNYELPEELMQTSVSGEELTKEDALTTRESGFHFKPDVLIFSDFEVGKSYSKKVLLTNISYTKNYCQFVGVSETLIDFIEVKFIPGGPMSPGLTCDLTVTFNPMINECLDGFIEMRSSSSIFKIFVKCFIKCFKPFVTHSKIEFKNVIVGEVQKKSITLRNQGALPAEYQFFNVNKEEKSCFITGKNYYGVLQAFGSVQLEIAFSPKFTGVMETDYKIIFLNETLDPIVIHVSGLAVDFPLFVEKEIINLRICMFDRLYQDSVVINNRASTTFRLRFEIPKELHDHLDILPKTAFIQPESQLSVQLKFLPRKSILTDAGIFLKKDVFEIPIIIRIANQVQYITFLLQSVITSSDIEFNTKEIDFGFCTIYERVSHPVKLINTSILAQEYGFVGVPEAIEIQPNDGFGTVLPNELLDIILFFNPKKAEEYNFELVCKSHIGRKFYLRCKGVGVLPPLVLSEQIIKFKPTAVMDSSTTHVLITNHHENNNPSFIPRIGNGIPFPVGFTMFEFVPPPNCPLEISPTCGRISPGQHCVVHITFAPKLDKDEIEKKALDLLKEEATMLEKQNLAEIAQLENAVKEKKGKGTTPKEKKSDSKEQKKPLSVNTSSKPISDRRLFEKNAESLLQKTFEGSFSIYKVPCFIAPDNCQKENHKQYKQYTLFLEVHCPSIRPAFLVFSADRDNIVNFGKVLIGRRYIQTVTIENLTEKSLFLSSSCLDPSGSFELVSSFKEIKPYGFGFAKLVFSPTTNKHFYDVLDIFCDISKTRLYLKGQGVSPCILLDPPGPIFNFGDVLVMDTIKVPLKINNTCEVLVTFDLNLHSVTSSYSSQTVLTNKSEMLVGPSNYSGMCVFGCSPFNGVIKPGESKEILLTFSPDHASDLFCDTLKINNENNELCSVKLCGRAWDSSVYSSGWDVLTTEKSFYDSLTIGDSTSKTLLLSFHCSMNHATSERVVQLGYLKPSFQAFKKICEYAFESLQESYEKGISIDFTKGTIEAGGQKNVTFKWQPTNFNADIPMQCDLQLTMKCEETFVYKILIRGYIE
ncbi:cilia- and flagella-associated protein 74 isoform X2 [Hydra vulgaris]|uniref:Cilia- and flagella-associated protein 74 isoform X2 n=1 Tax=Hydra vulgaris TaxID=6087 RepID=A0ABM4C179_HYDVU